jgi:GT2 family glycosyltransferase
MEHDLRLSVIIPTYETRELTLRCLAALRSCDPQPNEVIVVDNGSTDDTVHSVLQEYPTHTVARLPENEGFSAAVNQGVARASGDLLLLLNSDTEIEAPALGAVYKAFARDPQLGIVGAALRHPDGSPQWSGGRFPTWLWFFGVASGIPSLLGRLGSWRRLRSPSGSGGGTVDWVAGTAMVIRRPVWEQVGPFDLGYRFYCQDIDLCVNAADAGWKIAVLPDFKVFHHHGGTIAGEGGAVDRYHPELLWTDLLRFAHKCGSHKDARSAFRALRLGGRLRVVGRRLVSPMISKGDKAQWHVENSAYVTALDALDGAKRRQDLNRNGS